MASLIDVLTFGTAAAPTCADFADLRSKISAEFGAQSPAPKWLDNAHNNWQSGANCPGGVSKMFEAIGSSKATPKPAPSAAEAIGRVVLSAASTGSPALQKQVLAAVDAGAAAVAARLGLTPETQNKCTRVEFDALTPRQKMEFSVRRGRIVEPEPAKAVRPANLKTCASMTVAQFRECLNSAEQMAFMRRHGKLTD